MKKYKQFKNGTPLWYSLLIEHKLPSRYKIKINKIFRQNLYYKSENFIKKIDSNTKIKVKTIFWGQKEYLFSVMDSESVAGTYETVIKIMPKKCSVLDLGCGKKQAGKIFERFSKKVHYSDFEKLNIKNFTQADFNKKLPFKNNQFDLITSLDVIEHLENPYHFLRELDRISKKGFIISTPNVMSERSKNNFKKSGFFDWFEPKDHGYHIIPIFSWQIKKFCKENKLKLKIFGNLHFFNKNLNSSKSESLIYYIRK
ncbi:class I SAM-dependent methyltransferase [Candidatus Woesearchaeota archaeon]|nr:class I SAM-dependent methyltransferase [Candidatus Woesearchaeota archaeon]